MPKTIACLIVVLVLGGGIVWAAGLELEVDCARQAGRIRPLHGLNDGPVNFGETVDLTAYYRQLDVPLVRLHDCEWPAGDLVDMHAVFPDPAADPTLGESYCFARTDDYLQAIVATGAGIVYRLGESIEMTRRKYYVHPPEDVSAWSQACLGIIRHYNEGWSDGFQYGIRYWEIWNEPENRPNMWSGTNQQYYRLYATAARTIKAAFPDLRVGGPSVGATGELVDGKLIPTDFVTGFLDVCRSGDVPLDFFSWHTYSGDPYVFRLKARALRALLDSYGFTKTELHLNEWNYLPDDDWTPMGPAGQGARRRQWYDRMGGAAGAAFVVCTLIDLQDSPVDVANYYRGDSNPFGLFDRHATPKKTFYAMKAFRMLLDCPQRLVTVMNRPGQPAVCAGMNPEANEAIVLIGYFDGADQQIRLHIRNFPRLAGTAWQLYRLDGRYDLEQVRSGRLDDGAALDETIQAPGVLLWRLRAGQ
ncbi:MAG: hypothetical protein JW810_00300 [Sedimentisphaerales bacterium]|nr:hypothetical protein [Sedimentisphaerales bacterium]